jgi:hypothetical protein
VQEAFCFSAALVVVAYVVVQGVVPVALLGVLFVSYPLAILRFLLLAKAWAWRYVFWSHLERPIALASPPAAVSISRKTAVYTPHRNSTDEETDYSADGYDVHKVARG